MTKRLKAADPTMVDGPMSDDSVRDYKVSIMAMKISGMDDPRAISDKFAMVGFQMGSSTRSLFLLSASHFSTILVWEVIYSIASMKMSATIEIPMNNQQMKIA